ncbi:MAG: gluconolactonase [Bryobacterales bacterium]|nr:gluconolactonase [Bryobacterales bacterium]
MADSTRRAFLGAAVAACAFAQAPQGVSFPPSKTTRDWTGQVPVQYPDPDVVAVTPAFRKYMIGNTVIRKHHTGTLWAEGPAWNGPGKFLVWSDIPNNVQMRWIEEDSRVTTFRNPSGYSNGNTFDYEGRQLSCEHGGRRVVRYELNGTATVIADKFEGKKLNSPNDIVVHPDGTIWFTDPTYGIGGNYEGFKSDKETPEAVYRVDKAGKITKVADGMSGPNGICFSPDYKKVYVADTGAGRELRVYDLDGAALKNGKSFAKLTVPGEGGPSGADGMRCDTDGNLWCGARPGVLIVSPAGETIGMIRLPENCANVAFGGTKRNRLFMCASQSLYSVFVNATGAHIA